MEKKIYYVRMENNEYCDVKVFAESAEEAREIAQSNSYICQTDGSNFEVGEVSDGAFFIDDTDIEVIGNIYENPELDPRYQELKNDRGDDSGKDEGDKEDGE